mmetsp:Transcript_56523/g.105992  ORF Transcript_56523/g.105992 Transcript_56523/m.105992 type:complete len:818 (-) Transcript_56523:92-2545(-)
MSRRLTGLYSRGCPDVAIHRYPCMVPLRTLLIVSFITATLAGRPEEHCQPVPASAPALLQRAAVRNETETKLHIEAEPEEVGGGVAGELNTDLLGDSLEPTKSGHGLKDEAKAHEEHSDGYVVLLMFFGSLILGAGVMMALERFLPWLPYTVVMFLCGTVFAAWHFSRTPESALTWASWFRSVEKWEGISPHLLFYSFLPPLIFSEAMKLNVRLVQKCFSQVFLLACPGVLLGTGLVAIVARYMLPYDWPWSVALTFGAVLSATDPVAVVALFNTLGVSPRLTMLVSGESLMNDGTAIVVFALMLKVVLGATLDTAAVLTFFGHMSLTSIVFGQVAGLTAVLIIGKCAEERFHNDALIQIVTTLCCAYLAFFVAESELSTSGVLATVSSGFAVAYFAWPRFVSLEAMEAVWETVEFIGNTVIFFLAGLLFADTVFDSLGYIHASDFGWLLVLYVALLVIRALMLGVLWIPLNMVGSPVDWREAVAMIWSGLRGAVSLTLAIIIDEEPLVSRQMGARIMFHVGGIAALTLLINATTAAPLLRALGLARSSRADEKKLAVLSKHLAEHTEYAMKAARLDTTDLRFTGIDEGILRAMVPALSQELSHEASSGVGTETAQAYREAFLNVVKSHYGTAIQKGVVPRTSQSARLLLNSVDVAMDAASETLSDWRFIRASLETPPNKVFQFAGEYSMDETMRKAYCVLSFLEAHRQAREELPRFFHNDSIQVQDLIAAESKAQASEAARMLEGLDKELVTLARTEMLARKLLQEQLEEVSELKERGLLTASDSAKLGHRVQGALLTLLSKPKAQWMAKETAAGL